MLWESPNPAEPTRAVLTSIGTPVSRAFTVIGGAEGDPMRHAMAVIDSLHGDSGIPPLIAKQEVLHGLNGQFVPGQGILINTKSLILEFTTVHEIGHVLDFYGFESGRNESLSGHEMMPVLDACLASVAYSELQTLRARLSSLPADLLEQEDRQSDLKVVNYLLKRGELWSRAYVQWVSTFSQDAILLQQLEMLRQDWDYSRFFVQWNDADFARIGREIDLLFKRKGWLR